MTCKSWDLGIQVFGQETKKNDSDYKLCWLLKTCSWRIPKTPEHSCWLLDISTFSYRIFQQWVGCLGCVCFRNWWSAQNGPPLPFSSRWSAKNDPLSPLFPSVSPLPPPGPIAPAPPLPSNLIYSGRKKRRKEVVLLGRLGIELHQDNKKIRQEKKKKREG